MNEIDKLFKNIEDGMKLDLISPVDVKDNIMALSIDDKRISITDTCIVERRMAPTEKRCGSSSNIKIRRCK